MKPKVNLFKAYSLLLFNYLYIFYYIIYRCNYYLFIFLLINYYKEK